MAYHKANSAQNMHVKHPKILQPMIDTHGLKLPYLKIYKINRALFPAPGSKNLFGVSRSVKDEALLAVERLFRAWRPC